MEGGTNEAENLVTACGACNRGKGATPLSSVPQSLQEKAAKVAEWEAQIRAYYEILEAKKARKDDELWKIAEVFMKRFGDEKIHRGRLNSIRTFLRHLDYYEVLEAMEIGWKKLIIEPSLLGPRGSVWHAAAKETKAEKAQAEKAHEAGWAGQGQEAPPPRQAEP